MIKLENVVKKYKDFQLNMNLTVNEGEVVGLIGRNGSGKTTTFKSILGLIHINQGTITINGKPIDHLNSQDKQLVGTVLSDIFFYEEFTVKDIRNILKDSYAKFDNAYFNQLIQTYHIDLTKKVRHLSSGMKATLKLACAICHHPQILILDEPTAGLDAIVRDDIIKLLQDFMINNPKNSILISSHISKDLEGICDRINLIHQGRVIFEENCDALLNEYALLKVTKAQFEQMEKEYILAYKEESYGYTCLTNQRQYYLDNHKDISIDKCDIDDMYLLMEKGNRQ